MPLLSVTNLHKTYRLGRVFVPVLRGVDLSVERGEFVAILGASGSGKSTLLHLMGGLDRPDRYSPEVEQCRKCGYSLAGLRKAQCPECATPFSMQVSTIRYSPTSGNGDGVNVDRLSGGALDTYRSRDIGFVFQFYHLLPELSVMQNVLIGAMIRRGLGFAASAGEARELATRLLESVGLSHRLGHRPAELSGGERQRVAIARALINQPTLLLADEPTGNLDRETGRSILEMLLMVRRERSQTMVIVTHDPETAARADRVVRLLDGRVVVV